MKKLNLKALQLGANEVLSRAQLRNVLGGSGEEQGCCCVHNGNADWECGMSKAEAQKKQQDEDFDNWCCDSCSSLGAPAPCEA